MGDQDFGMDVPADDAFDQLFHAPDVRDPRTVNGLLIVDNIGRGLEGNRAAFAEEADLAPFAGGLDAGQPGFVVGGTVNGFFDTVAAGEGTDLGNIIRARDEDLIAEFEFRASSSRSGTISVPMIFCAPRALASMAVAKPTGPRPVTRTASLPLIPIFSRPS